MRITFTLTAKDILERQSAIDKAVGYKPWRSLAITSLLLLVLVGFIVITWILDKNSGNNFSLGACTMLAVAISMAALRMAKRKQMLRKGFSENQHLQGPRTADLVED
jgi:hypothetical protein